MKRALALALMLLLAAPAVTLADGKKHFKEGVKYAENRQWDKAAEKFALAVAQEPSNIEYQLRLRIALVQAGLMLVERGDMLAEKKDYNAAYQSYLQAYSFDRTNEMAYLKMRRMLELQGLPTDNLPSLGDPAGPAYKPKKNGTNLKASYTGSAVGNGVIPAQLPIPSRRFPKTDVIVRSDSLLSIIEQLAQDMGLNVLFDPQVQNQMRATRISVDLRNVTKPKALEMILKTNNLMYSQLDTRTLVIAIDNPQARMRYEPFAVRTFYIKNADATEVRTAINSTLQTKQIVPVKQLNALIVRDTPSNLELIESMIESLDKAKAEVLVDINIYEVSRNDLLRLGNQFNIPQDGQSGALNLDLIGGIGQKATITGKGPTTLFTDALGFAIGLPPSLISFFQDKGKAKLLASTQVHVIDNEQHSIRIGQRVPIQTAFIPTFTNTIVTGNARNQNNPNVQPTQDPSLFNLGVNPFGTGSGFPQFQYENVGLNIDMTPNVFEDEIQLKMKIESSSLDRSTGNFTPSFNQRTMSSVARIKDGQTTMVAGVSQTEQAKRVRGLPLIGLIPILGRFFATPEDTDRQSDVVITVTPHILRRADIRDEDHLAREAGTQADPTTQLTIEQILYLADQLDAQQNQVASDSSPPTTSPPNAARPMISRQPGSPQTGAPVVPARTEGVVVVPPARQPPPQSSPPRVERQQVDQPGQPVEPDDEDEDEDEDEDADENIQPGGGQGNQPTGPVQMVVRSGSTVATKGQDLYVAIIVNGSGDISYANISLAFDPNILEVKGVRDGGLLRAGGGNPEIQFTSENGVLNVQMENPGATRGVPARGQLLLLVFTVKNQGQTALTLNEQVTVVRTPDGQTIPVKAINASVEVR